MIMVARLPLTMDENTLLLMSVHHLMQNGVQVGNRCTQSDQVSQLPILPF